MCAASVTRAFGIQVASHSEARYHAFAAAFHFFRLRSRPSTFSAAARGIQVKIALAALQESTACGRADPLANTTCSVERKVWAMVSRYLWRRVGRYCKATPRYSVPECRWRQ